MGLRDIALRQEEAQGREPRPALRALDRADHARGRARPEAEPAPRAVVFKPLSAGEFVRAENEMQELLDVDRARLGLRGPPPARTRTGTSGSSSGTPTSRISSPARTSISSELQAKGFGEQLLAAIFRFDGGKHPVYLIYGYKRATFWPFVPTGRGPEARQRGGAAAEERAREGAADRARPLALARPLRRPAVWPGRVRPAGRMGSGPVRGARCPVDRPADPGAVRTRAGPTGGPGSGRPRRSARASPRASGRSAG